MQTGKLLVKPTKQKCIEKCVAFHLDVLKGEFKRNAVLEYFVENFDKTDFKINTENFSTVRLIGNQDVQYANLFSGRQAVTVIV